MNIKHRNIEYIPFPMRLVLPIWEWFSYPVTFRNGIHSPVFLKLGEKFRKLDFKLGYISIPIPIQDAFLTFVLSTRVPKQYLAHNRDKYIYE